MGKKVENFLATVAMVTAFLIFSFFWPMSGPLAFAVCLNADDKWGTYGPLAILMTGIAEWMIICWLF